MRKTAIAAVALVFAVTGCATKDYVHEYVDGQVTTVNKRVDVVDGHVATAEQMLNGRIDGVDATLNKHTARIDGAEATAREALDRAKSAGKLAEGKLLYQVVMSDDSLHFLVEVDTLSKQAMQRLDAFAAKLKAENRNVYIEIQGHTDNTGNSAHNLKLGERRAEMVKRYLNLKCGIPLHRMSVISYGESAPVASNKTRDGREKNRRVVLVVLN